MEQTLWNFSAELAGLVERLGRWAVAVEARPRMGSSGFLWRPGLIVTADHAIRREEGIPVILPEGNRATAELAGRDTGTDIALLRLQGAAAEAAPAFVAAPALRTGEMVLAVGRHEPGALALTGMVSTAGGAWKTWRGGQLDALLRLDMGAYPRSSGSLVADAQGRFAGMLTTGLTRTAPLAIPASTIERVATELAAHGRVARGYLGVSLQPIPLPEAFAKVLGRDQRSGVIVLNVQAEGPAEKAGIQVGDVIVEIVGHAVGDTDDVQLALAGMLRKPVQVVVFRGGERKEVAVTVGERRG